MDDIFWLAQALRAKIIHTSSLPTRKMINRFVFAQRKPTSNMFRHAEYRVV